MDRSAFKVVKYTEEKNVRGGKEKKTMQRCQIEKSWKRKRDCVIAKDVMGTKVVYENESAGAASGPVKATTKHVLT